MPAFFLFIGPLTRLSETGAYSAISNNEAPFLFVYLPETETKEWIR